MLVQDVPDDGVAPMGERLAGEASIALCYERARVLPDWPYNLYCILHGSSRSEILTRIDDVRQRLGLMNYPGEVIFSLARFKRDGIRYA